MTVLTLPAIHPDPPDHVLLVAPHVGDVVAGHDEFAARFARPPTLVGQCSGGLLTRLEG